MTTATGLLLPLAAQVQENFSADEIHAFTRYNREAKAFNAERAQRLESRGNRDLIHPVRSIFHDAYDQITAWVMVKNIPETLKDRVRVFQQNESVISARINVQKHLGQDLDLYGKKFDLAAEGQMVVDQYGEDLLYFVGSILANEVSPEENDRVDQLVKEQSQLHMEKREQQSKKAKKAEQAHILANMGDTEGSDIEEVDIETLEYRS